MILILRITITEISKLPLSIIFYCQSNCCLYHHFRKLISENIKNLISCTTTKITFFLRFYNCVSSSQILNFKRQRRFFVVSDGSWNHRSLNVLANEFDVWHAYARNVQANCFCSSFWNCSLVSVNHSWLQPLNVLSGQ